MTIEDVIKDYLPAIAQQARFCKDKLPSQSILEVEDLIQEGLIFVVSDVLPRYNGKTKFLTYLIVCLRNEYANKLKAEYNRVNATKRLAEEAKTAQVPILSASISGPREATIFRELQESFSDGLKEVLAMLMEPSEALLLRMRMAKNRGGPSLLGQLKRLARSKGLEWKDLCEEVEEKLKEQL